MKALLKREEHERKSLFESLQRALTPLMHQDTVKHLQGVFQATRERGTRKTMPSKGED